MKTLRVLLTLTIFACSGYAQPAGAQPQDPFSSKESVDASIKQVSCEREKRLDSVIKLFESVGVPRADIAIEKFENDKIQNVVVKKKGSTDETVVVGAHFDKVNEGCGVTDNWSGVVILAHIYKTLSRFTTKKSYVFVAFDQEEAGLRGSNQMVRAMTEAQRASVCSMMNFDSFGQGMPMALANASSSKMLRLAEELAEVNKFKFNSVTIPGASADSVSFTEKKVPAITLSGLNNEWTQIIHSPNDKIEKVNLESVYYNYRFGLGMIVKIDAAPCAEYR